MNGVNLNAFQFDYDLTFMSFFQDAEGRTYARYGGREDSGPDSQLTQKSLVKTMERVLKLHREDTAKPWSKYDPEPTSASTPEQIPPMRRMLAKRKEKCIHCHDVKNATFHDLASRDQLTKYMVFKYPSPKQLGISLDANDQTKVEAVKRNSAAAKAGVRAGDTILEADRQRVLTFADFTRVLEHAPETGTVKLAVQRRDQKKEIAIALKPNWRRSPDPSWRASTGVVGPNTGFWARKLNSGQKRQSKISPGKMGLKIVVVWGAWAKKAGVRNGDVVVGLDGTNADMSIRQLQTHLQLSREFGDTVDVTVLRGGKRRTLTMKLPAKAELH